MANTSRIDPTAFDALPLDKSIAASRQRIEAMERLLERVVVLPGLNRPIGLDVILGLVPIVGDIAAAALGSYIIWEARNLGLSKFQMARMMGNVGFDALLGFVPLIGDAADVLFRSNTRNLRIIRKHLDKHHPASVVLEG
ncbi:DUF4112 domain-containing protein [Sphingomonas sp. Leaf257]|jgi:hypothetical protein|uniref:DUF4112 domain-containing protein n=1 Tax=Sphingomonas sp. Leaf257 TaxID=1736309 RepID=UPI0006FC970A|nr:DUF4112 domain-containing protein [Sphingomonas sp. Leaf257]KQO49897.1 hypothetical protein ASF14_13850 [Sphingomonas sp. Leaf257]